MESTSMIQAGIFYLFGLVAIVSAIMVVALRNPLYSAASLVLTFFSIAAIYVLLQSEIIAVFQILVYAGAIMVLVIFVIMLLNLRPYSLKLEGRDYLRFGLALLITLFFLAATLLTVSRNLPAALALAKKGEITSQLVESEGAFELFSRALFSEYLLPFELASLLLTVAIMGVILLVRGNQSPSVLKKEN